MASALIGALVATATQVGAAVIGGATLSSIGFTAIAKTFLLTFAVGAVFNAFAPKPNQPVSSGYSVTNRGGNRDHQIIYGKTRVAGTIVVERLSGEGSTGGTRFLHRVIALAGHEVDGYESVYIDGKWVKNWYDPSTSSVITNITPYIDTDLPLYPNAVVELDENGAEVGDPEYPYLKDNYTTRLMAVRFWSGSDTQLASTAIQTEAFQGDSSLWGANHRLRGIAYIHVWAGFDQDAFRNGPPEVQPVVRGKKIYDPRTLTTAWSDNPALVIRDYLVSNYGLKEETVRIDDTIFTAAANACEVNANNGEDFYTCNGSFLTSEAPYDIINNLLTSYNGLLWYPQGKWRTKAGVWTSAVESFNEDDLRAPVSILTRHSRRTNFNTITGSLRGPETDYAVTEFPPVTNASFITEDNGLESSSNVDLPFTDNMDEARRIARIILERNRLQKTINLVVGLKGFKVQVGDVINLSLDRFGWSNKTFEVQAWTFGLGEGNDLQVSMILREIQSSVFDEVDDGVTYSGPFEPQLPEDIITDITPVWVSNNVVFEDYNGGTQLPVIKSRWSVTDINAVDYFEYQYRVSSFDYSSNGGKATLPVTPTDREQGIWDAYAGVLGRVPDQDGFTFYDTGAGSSLTIPEVRDSLANTAEFSSQEDFVTQTVTTQRTEIRGLTEEETYDIRVRSIAPSGLSSAWIAENVEFVADTLAPNPPTSFTVTGGYQQNTLTWANPTTNTDGSTLKDLKEIVVYASESDITPDTNDIVFTTNGNSFVHSGIGNEETWYYRLKALDYNGNYSSFTTAVNATTDAAAIDGERGAGRWHIDVDGVTYNNAGTTAGVGDLPVDSDDVQEAWDEGTGNQPTTQVAGDQAWFYQGEEANPTAQSVWIYDGSVWNEQNEVIDGNLLVTDTITTSKLYIKDTSLVYLDTFESGISVNEWESFSGLGSRTIETGQTDTELGGNALRVTSGSQIMAHNAIIPFNPNLTYKMTVRAKEVGGTTSFSAGFVGVGADGTTLVNANGADDYLTQHTHVLSGDALTASYANYVGFTKGYGASLGTFAEAPDSDSPGEMHPDVRYIRPFISAVDSSSHDVYIDSITVEVMTDANLIVDGTIVAEKLVINDTVFFQSDSGTLIIKDGAATSLVSDVYDPGTALAGTSTPTYTEVCSLNVTVPTGVTGDVLLNWSFNQGYQNGIDGQTWGYRLERDGTVLISRTGMSAVVDLPASVYEDSSLSAGTYTYTLEWWAEELGTGDINLSKATLTATSRWR